MCGFLWLEHSTLCCLGFTEVRILQSSGICQTLFPLILNRKSKSKIGQFLRLKLGTGLGGAATSTVLQPQSDFRSSWTEKVAVFHFVARLSLIHYWGQSAWFSWHCWGKIQHFSNKIKRCFKESAAKSVWPFFCETLWPFVCPEEMEIRAEQNFFCWFALKVVEKLVCDYLKQIHRLS